MKFAILYSGHLRTLLDTIDNHKEYITDYDKFDIYLNLWDGWGNGHVFKEYQFEDTDLITDEIKNILIKKLNPKFYEFQNYSTIYNEITEVMKLQDGIYNTNKIQNVISMYYKLQRGFDHIKNSNIKYDGILRLRPDNVFLSEIKLFKPEKNTLYTSLEYRWCINGNGVNDQFGFGDMETMNKYTSVYCNLEKIWSENKNINCAPEILLKTHLTKFNTIVKDILSGNEWDGRHLHKIMREDKNIV